MRAKYFYGYNIVAAGFAIQAVSIGAMFAYGVFFKEFQVEFGWSRATISGASSNPIRWLINGAMFSSPFSQSLMAHPSCV